MLWDKKEDNEDGLPDLPALKPALEPKTANIPEFPELEEDIEERHSLPSFPDSPTERGFSQAAIKDAVGTEEIKEKEADLPELPEFPDEEEHESTEMKEWHPSKPVEAPLSRHPSPHPVEHPPMPPAPLHATPMPPPPMQSRALSAPHSKESDVFVKIDKFHSAKKALMVAKEKLADIDTLLKKIRETKMREEQELAGWEKELTAIKSKVQDVTENIFEKA